MERKLKIALCVLIIVLISMISFVGIFSKNIYTYTSVIPDYTLSTEFNGKRVSYFTVDTSTEKVIYDADGNVVDEIPEDDDESNYTTEDVAVNAEEDLTTANYEKVKSIFEGRLDELGVEEYSVRLNKETGEIAVELEDDTITDNLLQYLLCDGDFSITDSDDGTVLLDKSDLKSASVVYASTDSSTITVYLDLQFTSEGTKKLEEISNTYIEIEDSEEEESEDTDTETDEETTEDTETETESEETEEQKTITITIEGTEFLTTYFSEVIATGELTISIGSSSDNDTLNEYISQGQIYAMLLNNDEMPLTYELTASEYMPSSLGENAVYVIIAILAVICVAIIVYMIIRYKVNGLLASISFIGAIAILLLLIRYTTTSLSIGGFASMLVLILIDVYFMNKVLKDIKENPTYENVKKTTFKTYLNEIETAIVFLIIAIVFTFMSELEIYSIGMTLFYGLISIAISNLAFMRIMLMAKYDE